MFSDWTINVLRESIETSAPLSVLLCILNILITDLLIESGGVSLLEVRHPYIMIQYLSWWVVLYFLSTSILSIVLLVDHMNLFLPVVMWICIHTLTSWVTLSMCLIFFLIFVLLILSDISFIDILVFSTLWSVQNSLTHYMFNDTWTVHSCGLPFHKYPVYVFSLYVEYVFTQAFKMSIVCLY